jgi:hypothetical protein
MYNFNSYGEVESGPGTYEQAAMDLYERGQVRLNWVDGMGTLLNVLLSFDPTVVGAPGGRISGGPGQLYVSVAGMGMHAWTLGSSDIFSGYLAEKIMSGQYVNTTATKLAELVSGVRRELTKMVTADHNPGEEKESNDTHIGTHAR